jgi:hypothetical protein
MSPADPLVQPERVGEYGHVAAGHLAQLGHRVDEADLGRQERVRRVLDQLRGGQVAGDHRRLLGQRDRVHLLQQPQCVIGLDAEDQPVRLQRVADRETLAEELRLPGDLDPVAGRCQRADPLLQGDRGADRHGRPADDQRRLGEPRRQRIDRRLQLTQVGRAVLPGGRAEREEVHVGPVRDLVVVQRESQPPGRGVLLQQVLQAVLEDVRLARVELLHDLGNDVDADDLVAELGHPGGERRAEIARPDDADAQSHPASVAHLVERQSRP